MRYAVVGTGRIGELHARLLGAIEGVDELVVADADPARARAVAASIGASAAESPVEAIEAADAVVIAAATGAHAELIEASVSHGRPTFCEKPLAPGLDASRTVAAVVDASGVPFQLGFHRRFDPGYVAARELVASGGLGRLYAIRLASHDPEPAHEGYIAQSGGMFRDLAIHDLDVLRFLTGAEVEEVYVDGSSAAFPVYGKYADVDTAVATFRMTDGTLAVLTATRHDPRGYDVRAELFGSRDSVSLGDGPRAPIRSVEPGVAPPSEPGWPIFLERFEAAYAAELRAFVELAEGRGTSRCTARDGVEAMRTAEACDRSRRDHRPVRVDEIPA